MGRISSLFGSRRNSDAVKPAVGGAFPAPLTSSSPASQVSNGDTGSAQLSAAQPLSLGSSNRSRTDSHASRTFLNVVGGHGASPASSANVSRTASVARGSSTSVVCVGGGRFEIFDDGTHVHRLKNTRRQEKLTRMLKDIMGPSHIVGDNAVSAVHEIVQHAEQLSLMSGLVKKVEKGELEVGNVNGASMQLKKSELAGQSGPGATAGADGSSGSRNVVVDDKLSLVQKYGKCQEVIGKGSYGVVRISHKTDSAGREQLFAVKEFRKRTPESETSFHDRLMSEFCLSSQLRHPNIITTLDLMKDPHGGYCQIMEFCPGGDLYTLILSSGGGLAEGEADCFFKQIMRGVVYMHSMGVAHCDLKPENILLTSNGTVKISDFGNGECFRMAWEKSIHLSSGVCGSGPYIAPEEFKEKPFDPRPVDIWAVGIIYMVMRTGSYLWRTAVGEEDSFYQKYLLDRKKDEGYAPIEKLAPSKCVYVIYSILDPVPSRRITGKQVLNSEWGRSIRCCEAATEGLALSSPPSSANLPAQAQAVAT